MKKMKLLFDVGCGEGNCCINYAKKGYAVIGVEKDAKVFKNTRENINKSEEKESIVLHNKDIRKIKLDKKLDGILFNYVLMFMPKSDALNIIEKYYKKLNKKGEMLIRILMFDDPVAASFKDKKKVFFPSYDELEEIQKQYEGKLEFKLTREKAHGGIDHLHIHSTGRLKIVK